MTTYNKYKIVKLDGRHKGVGTFDYYVDFYHGINSFSISDQVEDFKIRRVWCWDSFGPGQELDYTFGTDCKWAWWREAYTMRLYFTESALSAYVLQWV